ncbi:MAG: hypothetical protein ACPGQL_09155 [Thermoplasmatota archaeon]
MNKAGILLAGMLLVASAVPGTATEVKNLRDVNEAYILDLVGDAYDPSDAEALAAFEIALDRLDTNNVNLLTLNTGVIAGAEGIGAAVGDLFLISIHGDGCPSAPTEANPLYPDVGYAWLGSGTTGGSSVSVIDRNGVSPSAVFGFTSWAGSSDYFCLDFFGITLDLPYVLGAATSGI